MYAVKEGTKVGGKREIGNALLSRIELGVVGVAFGTNHIFMHFAIYHSYSYIQLALLRFISSRFYNASDDNIVSDAAVDGIVFYGCVC